MAKSSSGVSWKPDAYKKKTSIGASTQTRFTSKHDKRSKKKYRGQGR